MFTRNEILNMDFRNWPDHLGRSVLQQQEYARDNVVAMRASLEKLIMCEAIAGDTNMQDALMKFHTDKVPQRIDAILKLIDELFKQ